MSAPSSVNELFNSPEADLIVRSAFVDSADSWSGRGEVSTDFRLQKEQLACISFAFRDMLDKVDKGDGDECPIIQIDEGASVFEEILRLTIRDDIGTYSRLSSMTPELLVVVWKASNKYRIADVQIITEAVIEYVASNVRLLG